MRFFWAGAVLREVRLIDREAGGLTPIVAGLRVAAQDRGSPISSAACPQLVCLWLHSVPKGLELLRSVTNPFFVY